MGFLSFVRVISEVAPSAGGLVARGPPAGVPVVTPGGAGQPSRRGPAGPGHACLSTMLFIIGIYSVSRLPTPVMLLSAAVIRRRLAQISA